MDVVGVSRVRTSGSFVTKSGRKAYRGQRKHWYVYFYDDEGKFRKKKISALEVPYYGSLIRRRKSYICPQCLTKFRSLKNECPNCSARAQRLESGVRSANDRAATQTPFLITRASHPGESISQTTRISAGQQSAVRRWKFGAVAVPARRNRPTM